MLLTNNAKDFESLHAEYDHAGILLYYDQNLPDTDPEGLARTVAEVFEQHDTAGIENRLVDLGSGRSGFRIENSSGQAVQRGNYSRNSASNAASISGSARSHVARFENTWFSSG